MKFGAHLRNLVKRSFCGLFSFIIAISSVSAALPLLVADNIYAAGVEPTCTSGEIIGDNNSVSFEIVLNCSDLSAFDNSGSTSADQLVDLPHVTLHMNSWDQHPLYGNIVGDRLIFTFKYCPDDNPAVCPVDSFDNKDTTTRDLSIAAGTLRGETKDDLNELILMTADEIIDKNTPYAADDFYDTNEATLSVSPEQGILSNDEEAEGSADDLTITLDSEPTKGSLLLSPNGSFVYIRDEGYFDGDEFSYYVTDAALNNSKKAFVYISDQPPQIDGVVYRQGSGDANKAKVGDTVVVEVVSNEPIALDQVTIAGNLIDEYPSDFDTRFTMSYVMTDDDENGDKGFAIIAHDLSGQESQSRVEFGVLFNKDPPVITLLGDDELELGSPYDYDNSAVAFDALGEELEFTVDGSVDSGRAGYYTLTYRAIDSFGNQAGLVTRQIQVVDTVLNDFVEYGVTLGDMGVGNNLDEVNSGNYMSFAGLYFEVDNGRIQFNQPIDLSDGTVVDFIIMINEYIEADVNGTLGLNLVNFDSDFPLRNLGATLIFRNLDRIGYTANSTAEDVFRGLNIYDDEGRLIDKSEVANDHGVYYGCSSATIECFTYVLNINHFTKFIIDDYIAPPLVDILPDISLPIVSSESSAVSAGQTSGSINTVKSAAFMNNKTNTERWVGSVGSLTYEDSDDVSSDSTNNSVENLQEKQNRNESLQHDDFSIAWYWWLIATGALTIIVVCLIIKSSNY